MANGKVCTGFSYPWVALYANNGTTVSYSNAQPLARGVDVTLSPDSESDNKFYADNRVAEDAGGKITSCTLSLTVDGLKAAAERLITGLPAEVDGWTAIGGTSQVVPYVGVGWLARYMEEGVASYVAILCSKVKFNAIEKSAATQEDAIDFQTQSLEGTIVRSDSAEQEFYFQSKDYAVGTTYATEAAAEAAALEELKSKLGV